MNIFLFLICFFIISLIIRTQAQPSSGDSPSLSPSDLPPTPASPSTQPSTFAPSPAPSSDALYEPAPPSNWCIFPQGYQLEAVILNRVGSSATCFAANHPYSATTRPSPLNFSACGVASPFNEAQAACFASYLALYCQVSCPQFQSKPLVVAQYCANFTQNCLSYLDEHGKVLMTFPEATPDCPLLVFSNKPSWLPCENGPTTAPVVPSPILSANITLALEEVAPFNSLCLFPPDYIVGDRYLDFCEQAAHPIAQFSNGTLLATSTDSDNAGQSNTFVALSSVVFCGDLKANGAIACMNLVFDTICQALCPRKNVTSPFLGYDSGVFPRSRCDEIDLRCAYFTNSRCFFSPVSKEMQAVKLGGCEGGSLTLGAPANTDPTFPYVVSNTTLISNLLDRFAGQGGVYNISPVSPAYIPSPTSSFETVFANPESFTVTSKPWWYYFVIILIVGMIIGASIFAALLYKKKFIDDPAAEELLLS